jgi:hypothetical protein
MRDTEAEHQYEPTQSRSIIGRLVRRHPHTATAASCCCWLAAITVLILHTRGDAVRDNLIFSLDDVWLIASGCLGLPIQALGFLGRRLTARTLEGVATGCYTFAAGMTVLAETGRLELGAQTATFTLILFLAMGNQSVNSAYAIDRQARIEDRARAEERANAAEVLAAAQHEYEKNIEAAYIAGITAAFDAQHSRARQVGREIEHTLASDTGDLSAVRELLNEELAARHAKRHACTPGAKLLRLVTGSVEHADGPAGLPPTGTSRSDRPTLP